MADHASERWLHFASGACIFNGWPIPLLWVLEWNGSPNPKCSFPWSKLLSWKNQSKSPESQITTYAFDLVIWKLRCQLAIKQTNLDFRGEKFFFVKIFAKNGIFAFFSKLISRVWEEIWWFWARYSTREPFLHPVSAFWKKNKEKNFFMIFWANFTPKNWLLWACFGWCCNSDLNSHNVVSDAKMVFWANLGWKTRFAKN